MVLEAGWGRKAAFMEGPEGVTGLGVDQANEGVCDLLESFRGFWEVAEADVESHPASRGSEEVLGPTVPFTRRSKSTSPSSLLLLVEKALALPNDMKSSLFFVVVPFAPDSSCNFFVCSDSTREDRLLMSSMKD
jgi:hypothetical protein